MEFNDLNSTSESGGISLQHRTAELVALLSLFASCQVFQRTFRSALSREPSPTSVSSEASGDSDRATPHGVGDVQPARALAQKPVGELSPLEQGKAADQQHQEGQFEAHLRWNHRWNAICTWRFLRRHVGTPGNSSLDLEHNQQFD